MGKHGGDEVWIARLEDFLNDCVGSAEEEESARLADAADVFLSDALIASHPDNAAKANEVRRLIAAGAAVDATLAITGTEAAFMLSRGGGGTCLATMILTGDSEEVVSEAATPALALLAAFAAALLTQVGREPANTPARDARAGARLH